MAKRIDTVTITIDAAAARKEVDALRKRGEELGKSLAEMKKQLEDPGLSKTSAEWKQLNREYKELKREQKELNQLVEQGEQSIKGMNDVLANLSKATYNDLIKQQRILQRTIKNTSPDTKKYAELQAALRAVNGQVDKLKAGWEDHENQIVATERLLASYVAVYGGFNFIVGKLKEVFNGTLELSDAMSDVQKTTGIAGDELNKLSREIDSLDTRTTQQELHELAATAGQIGLESREDVLGFVKASNELTVALNELGDDGVLSLTKIAQLTGDIERLGVEGALKAIGSSINELEASSSAAAGPIADFISRVGSVAPIANLATSDLAAMGATADALGQQMEVSGTSMSKFITSIVNNTESIAFALNMEEDTLKDLIDTGQTMEAIIQVLEKVKQESDISGGALTEVFKEFGSEGERMVRVIQAMANNTDLLREQVTLSAEAFANATSVTEEYNVKNENAAAIAQRISNAWKEFFVSADNTNWATNILNKLLSLTKLITGTSNASTVLQAAIFGLTTALVTSAKGVREFFSSIGELVSGIKVTDSAFVGHVRTLITAKRTTEAYRTSVNALNASIKAFMAANWFTLLATAATTVYYAVKNWNREQRELNAAISELNTELRKEKDSLVEVSAELEKVKDDTQARGLLINKINERYKDYLDYQIDEAAGYDEIHKALKLVNEQLDLKYSKQVYDKRMEKANETFTEDTENAQKSVINWLKNIETVGDTAFSVYEDLRVAIMDVAKGMSEPIGQFDHIGETMQSIFDKTEALKGYNWEDLPYADGIRKLLNAQIELNEAQKAAIAEQDANYEAEQEQVAKAQSKLVEEQQVQMKKLINLPAEALEEMDELEIKKHYERILNYGNAMLREADRQFEEFKKANPKGEGQTQEDYNKKLLDKKADLQETLTGGMVEELEVVRKAYAGDAWGKAFNINGWKTLVDELDKTGTASVKSLVDTYKEMEEATQKYSDVNELNRVFKTNYTNIADMQLYIRSLAQKLEQALNAQGRNTSGGFLKDRADAMRREREQEMKKEFEAAKSALEAYYREQQRIINELYLGQAITKEEHTRRISQSNQEMKRSFVDLYSVILGEAKKYGTDFDKILPGKDLQLLAKNLTDFGPAMVDGLKNARANSELEIQNEAIKIREIIEKALLEGDMFGKLETEFRTMLDELSLLTSKFGSEFIAVDESTAKALVSQLVGMADEAYTMTEQELLAEAKKRSEGNETLTAWWSGVDEDQLTLILEKLKGYYDDRLEMQRRYTQRMQREWQQYYKQTGAQAEYEANKRMIEAAKNEPEGYVKGAGDYDSERGIIAAEVALEAERIGNNIGFLEEQLKARALSVNKITADMIARIKAAMASLDENSPEYKNFQAQIALMEQSAMKALVDSGDEEAVALNASIAEQTQSMNAIIQQSEIETTNVTLEQWQKRAEAASEWAEMVGETIGDVASLERQANRARLRGDEETARELEAQAEESKQNLVKSALNKAIDMAKVWAMELGFKVMYNALAQKSDEKLAAASANATVKEVFADIIAQGFKGAGKEIGSRGVAGLITGGVIIAAAAGLAAAAKAAVANMFPEATEGVSDGSTSTKRKLTTGMLTYANGKYPVLGNDGVVYDAEYAGANMKTGVYRGPHYGIFSEKKPEMVIDGNTTQRLVLNYPEVYNGILQLSRTGSMRTYADGNVSEFAAATSAQQQAQMEEMQMALAATAAAVHALNERLKYPLSAEVNYFGKGGIQDSTKRGDVWAKKNRVG